MQNCKEQQTGRELGLARKKLVEQILRFGVATAGMAHSSLKIEQLRMVRLTLKIPAADAIRVFKPTTRQTEPNDFSRRRVVVGIQFDDAPPVRQGQFLEPLLFGQGLDALCALMPQVHPKPVGFRLLRTHLTPVCQNRIGLVGLSRADEPEGQCPQQFDVVRVVLQRKREASVRLPESDPAWRGGRPLVPLDPPPNAPTRPRRPHTWPKPTRASRHAATSGECSVWTEPCSVSAVLSSER